MFVVASPNMGSSPKHAQTTEPLSLRKGTAFTTRNCELFMLCQVNLCVCIVYVHVRACMCVLVSFVAANLFVCLVCVHVRACVCMCFFAANVTVCLRLLHLVLYTCGEE
eukprot:scpid108453/ scgid18505/ 